MSMEATTAVLGSKRGDRKCGKMACNYLHILYQCQFPGLDIVDIVTLDATIGPL